MLISQRALNLNERNLGEFAGFRKLNTVERLAGSKLKTREWAKVVTLITQLTLQNGILLFFYVNLVDR